MTNEKDDRASFLQAAQRGDLKEVQQMFAEKPSLLHVRSTSKGYSAMHYAAMAGSLPLIQWFAEQGLAPDCESSSGASPIEVALEYKRLPAARLLQQLRDASTTEANLTFRATSQPASRPAPRHPSWIAQGGIHVHELHGTSAETAAEAVRLAAGGATIVWRQANLCPSFPTDIRRLGLEKVRLDTNVSPRCDRRYAHTPLTP